MYQKIEKWIDKVLQQDFPDDVVAVMFNLYEDGDALYSMEVVGTESFDEDFETRENPLVLKSKSDWEEMLSTVSGCLKRYLSEGKHADKLKGCTAVATGFVDGDIEILYTKA